VISAVSMEVLAEKILGEICREVDTGIMDVHLLGVVVLKAPPGLVAQRWGAVHEGEHLKEEASEDLHEVVLAAEDLVRFTEKAIDISSNLI